MEQKFDFFRLRGSSNIYYEPTNWDNIASQMREQEIEEEDEMPM